MKGGVGFAEPVAGQAIEPDRAEHVVNCTAWRNHHPHQHADDRRRENGRQVVDGTEKGPAANLLEEQNRDDERNDQNSRD